MIRGHCLVGSLTGVVASKSVTEASKGASGRLVTDLKECNGIRRLTGRQTCRAGRKLGHSDPADVYGNSVAQRIKGTPGITG